MPKDTKRVAASERTPAKSLPMPSYEYQTPKSGSLEAFGSDGMQINLH